MPSNGETVELLIEAWKLMVGRFPGAVIEHSKGVASIFAQVPLPFLNICVPDSPLANAKEFRDVLGIVRDRAKTCEHGSLLALGSTGFRRSGNGWPSRKVSRRH